MKISSIWEILEFINTPSLFPSPLSPSFSLACRIPSGINENPQHRTREIFGELHFTFALVSRRKKKRGYLDFVILSVQIFCIAITPVFPHSEIFLSRNVNLQRCKSAKPISRSHFRMLQKQQRIACRSILAEKKTGEGLHEISRKCVV